MSLRAESIGDAVVLTIDRPDRQNAIDRSLARLLGEAMRIAAADLSVRGIVLTGAGDRVFIAGGDLREIDQLTRAGSSASEVLDMFKDLAIVEHSEVPVIAAVQGDVIGGGCEMLLLCDFVIMEEHATMQFRHAKMGLSPAWGGLTRLLERAGPLEATRLLLTADRIEAAEALRLGLVNEVVPKGAARARAIALVNRIADNPRTTVAALKQAIVRVRQARRGAGLDMEREVFSERWGGPDHRNAMDEFMSRK